MSEFKKLLGEAARNLSGKDVIVRLKHPVYSNVEGLMHKSVSGDLIIDLDPGIGDYENFLKVFLHECAHAYLHADVTKRSDLSTKVSRSMVYEGKPNKGNEVHADELSKHWFDWCEKNYQKYYEQGFDEIECKLNALAHYPRKEVK